MRKEVVSILSQNFSSLCVTGPTKPVAVIGAQLEALKFSDVLVVVDLNSKLYLCSSQTVI